MTSVEKAREIVRIEATERQGAALELRLKGMSYRQIAEQLQIQVGTAHELVNTYLLNAVTEPGEELRTLEVERLDVMLKAIWADVEAGDVKAIDAALKISDRRAKLLGIDAPTKIEHSGSIDMTASADEARRKLSAIVEQEPEGEVVRVVN